jgi:hypothetical protein
MATVKETREWMAQFPDETEVDVLVRRPGRRWEGDNFSFEPLDLGKYGNQEFIDFREGKNKFVNPGDPRHGKMYLWLGEN